MQSYGRGIRLAVVGWAGVVAYAVLLALAGDQAPAAVFAAIAVAVSLWLWRSGGRAASSVSLGFGALFALQHVAYSVADVGVSTVTLLGDLYGLAVGIAIVVGSSLALLAARRKACLTC